MAPITVMLRMPSGTCDDLEVDQWQVLARQQLTRPADAWEQLEEGDVYALEERQAHFTSR